MPRDPLRTPDAHVSPLAVCTCGYDLTGLPEDAAAKCPECGAVVAEIEPRVPWYRRWTCRIVAGMMPAFFLVAALPYYDRVGGPPPLNMVAPVLESIGLFAWPTVSAYAFSLMSLRVTRAKSFQGRFAAVVVGILVSFAANFAVIQLGTLFWLRG
jgi:uncharacterized paraquat-inducible protein A